MTIRPQVLVLRACAHRRAALSRAELHQDAVKHIDLIVKLNRVHRQPLVQVLTSGKLDSNLHVATAKSHAGYLFQLVATRTLLNLLFRFEALRLIETGKRLTLDLFTFH